MVLSAILAFEVSCWVGRDGDFCLKGGISIWVLIVLWGGISGVMWISVLSVSIGAGAGFLR